MSGGFPRNLQELQNALQNAQKRGSFGGVPGGGRARPPIAGIIGVVALAGGFWFFNNALFNGVFLL
jgi:hypothetical protein